MSNHPLRAEIVGANFHQKLYTLYLYGEKYCVDVLNQLSAVVGATQKVGLIILKDHIQGCIKDALIQDDGADNHIEELMTVIEKFTNRK